MLDGKIFLESDESLEFLPAESVSMSRLLSKSDKSKSISSRRISQHESVALQVWRIKEYFFLQDQSALTRLWWSYLIGRIWLRASVRRSLIAFSMWHSGFHKAVRLEKGLCAMWFSCGWLSYWLTCQWYESPIFPLGSISPIDSNGLWGVLVPNI